MSVLGLQMNIKYSEEKIFSSMKHVSNNNTILLGSQSNSVCQSTELLTYMSWVQPARFMIWVTH